ncbi:MAG: hypothetical protein Q9160_005523 [Pyrenula sp. 1 TL-2023]
MHHRTFLAIAAFIQNAFAYTNLFDDGRQGPILGTSFGVPGANATFDYVIVGGGTAGLTVASRLAEDPSISVAVVEAGGFYELDNGNLSVVPGYASYFTGTSPSNFQPLVDWGFLTTPQAQWADTVGDDSYTWANFEQYYKKSTHYTAPNQSLYTNSTNLQTPQDFSVDGGPLQVSFSNNIDPWGTWVQKLFGLLGMTEIDGFNSGRLLGSAYSTFMIDPRNGHRSSSEASFLQNALENGRAPIMYKNTLVSRIIFDGNKTATGVRALTAGTFGTPSVEFTLNARREVIIAGGAFQSPQLLMVSGIGPCAHISQQGIPCLEDLPGVGQNMWDHPIFGITHRVNVPTTSAAVNNATLAAQYVQRYLTTASGPLSALGAGIYGWEKLPEPYRSSLSNASLSALSAFPTDWPEIEWLPQNSYTGNRSNNQLLDPRDGHSYATLSMALIAPLSRGSVTLAGPDMTTLPNIDPNTLTDPVDIDMALQLFKRGRAAWKILVDLGLADPVEAYPGDNIQTDDQIRKAIADMGSWVYHAAATCAMGDRSRDSMAVVDSRARVFGVQGLRVVDASSFPFLVPGHPTATVYALAEKISDDILNGTGGKKRHLRNPVKVRRRESRRYSGTSPI